MKKTNNNKYNKYNKDVQFLELLKLRIDRINRLIAVEKSRPVPSRLEELEVSRLWVKGLKSARATMAQAIRAYKKNKR